jgi:hypothetical protein
MMFRSTWRYHDDDPPPPPWFSTTVIVLSAAVFGVVWMVVSLGLPVSLVLRLF